MPPKFGQVYIWSTGSVSVVDEGGRQLPDYQGRYVDVIHRVLADADADTKWRLGVWGTGLLDCPREDVEKFAAMFRQQLISVNPGSELPPVAGAPVVLGPTFPETPEAQP